MKQVTWQDVGASSSNPLLSPAYKFNGCVFTSGSVGSDSDGSFPEDVSKQTELAILSLKSVLEKSGSSLEKTLKVLLFIADGGDSGAVNAVYSKYFPHAPARSCVIVSFPNKTIKVELECVAEEI